jgi:hypothetical protein
MLGILSVIIFGLHILISLYDVNQYFSLKIISFLNRSTLENDLKYFENVKN